MFTREDKENIPIPTNRLIKESLETIQITPDLVCKKLKKLIPEKSPGHDNWHPYFLREIADVFCIPLSFLFNKSLKEGAHESWLKAIRTAIYKKGARSDPGNYRPISLASVISKVMESLIRDELLIHLVRHAVLSDCQHGFVPSRDCITQLLLCLEDWTLMRENNQTFDVIYTDFSKAFNSAPHERLLRKLEHVGIRGDLLNWIRSFLMRRTQCVRVEGKTSTWKKVISGIPQGSVLGPLLFVIFINDLPDEVKYNICKMFADDCKIYGLVENVNLNKLQRDLCTLEVWYKKWQLPFNAENARLCISGENNPEYYYVLNNHVLEKSDQEKDLGVIIDKNLKFHAHTAAAVKIANQVLGLIKKSYHSRDSYTIKTFYKAMVRPHLEYGNAIWGSNYLGDIKILEKIQRRATKMTIAIKDLHYEERLKELKLPSLVYRRRRGDMIIMYKIMNNLVRIDRMQLFSPPNAGSQQKSIKETCSGLCKSEIVFTTGDKQLESTTIHHSRSSIS